MWAVSNGREAGEAAAGAGTGTRVSGLGVERLRLSLPRVDRCEEKAGLRADGGDAGGGPAVASGGR